jgi:hypothetical protein
LEIQLLQAVTLQPRAVTLEILQPRAVTLEIPLLRGVLGAQAVRAVRHQQQGVQAVKVVRRQAVLAVLDRAVLDKAVLDKAVLVRAVLRKAVASEIPRQAVNP